ncbi:TPA: hypothetical protein L6B08_26120 [Pseudomonas aeruginosa]|nr:hypothetical protein AO898_29800 [Pseudomonas aeruginosa]OPD70728.1 hypothetical protein AO896_29700 [Pseudomonas aeruginosa]OPD87108.1 hypothetical protein AO955_30930 [Pseudomonas aeruginosa]HBP6463707.1 hypothetical protein [Pseudomonas aeruginosa]HBP6823343.1 hypothetical protein [Pseudomonas aeruginosa]
MSGKARENFGTGIITAEKPWASSAPIRCMECRRRGDVLLARSHGKISSFAASPGEAAAAAVSPGLVMAQAWPLR